MKTVSTGNAAAEFVSFPHDSNQSGAALLTADTYYPPDPPDAANRPSVLSGTAGYIIVTEFCERLAYFGFAGSLVLFFQTKLNMSNADADVQYSAWAGACYVTPLLGGYIADTYLGRYKSILVFSAIYLVGLGLMVLGSIPGDASDAIIFPGIYIIAMGTGGIKPNGMLYFSHSTVIFKKI
jgi:solute carrier family 15 (peptide/histidine transporter), member 3/4